MIKLLVFDLDGTLIDSRQDIISNVNRAFKSLGMPALPDRKIASLIGLGSDYMFQQLLGQGGSQDKVVALVDAYKLSYSKHFADYTDLYPGVIQVLQHFSHIPKVIVTNKGQAAADQIASHLDIAPYFEGIFGLEAFAKQKPDPMPIQEVCRRWKVKSEQTAIAGDSEFDITAGRRAGVRTIGALYGFTKPSAMRACQPDFLIDLLVDLISLPL